MKINSEERGLALLGYLMFLFLIPLFARRESMFVQFHARQGAVMFGLWVVYSLLTLIILVIASGVSIVESIFIGLWILFNIVYGVFGLIAIIKVLLGERYRMPVVADVALKLNL